MNYKGKIVKVRFYEYFTSKLIKEVIGKVLYIHTSQGTKDGNFIEIIDDKNIKHSGGYNCSFVIAEVIK